MQNMTTGTWSYSKTTLGQSRSLLYHPHPFHLETKLQPLRFEILKVTRITRRYFLPQDCPVVPLRNPYQHVVSITHPPTIHIVLVVSYLSLTLLPELKHTLKSCFEILCLMVVVGWLPTSDLFTFKKYIFSKKIKTVNVMSIFLFY